MKDVRYPTAERLMVKRGWQYWRDMDRWLIPGAETAPNHAGQISGLMVTRLYLEFGLQGLARIVSAVERGKVKWTTEEAQACASGASMADWWGAR